MIVLIQVWIQVPYTFLREGDTNTPYPSHTFWEREIKKTKHFLS